MRTDLLQLTDQDVAALQPHIAAVDYLALNTARGPYDLMLFSAARRQHRCSCFHWPSNAVWFDVAFDRRLVSFQENPR